MNNYFKLRIKKTIKLKLPENETLTDPFLEAKFTKIIVSVGPSSLFNPTILDYLNYKIIENNIYDTKII